jgi:hypothetical protein
MVSARRLTIIILIVALMLTACGNDDKDEDKNNSKNDSDQKTSLSQTLTATNGVTVKYPDGWVAVEENGDIQIVNSQEALDAADITAGQAGLMLMDPAIMEYIATEGVELTPVGLLTAYAGSGEDGGMTMGDVTETTVGDKKAARLAINDDKSEGFIMVVQLDESSYIVAMGITAKGELSKFEKTLLDMVSSITYAAPAAPAEATEESAG